MASFGLLSALAACSGKSETDSPSGSLGGNGNAGASSSAGHAGVAGSGAGGSGVGGGVGSGGSAGKGGGSAGSGGTCSAGQTMSDGCNDCTCADGQWACTNRACVKSCGGFVGQTCSATEYCAYTLGQLCGAADASSTCMPRPSACDDIYSPVCGCDQMTYASSCDAAMHGQGVYSSGECPITAN